jgi:uncharacterized Zn-finger protein
VLYVQRVLQRSLQRDGLRLRCPEKTDEKGHPRQWGGLFFMVHRASCPMNGRFSEGNTDQRWLETSATKGT